MGLKSGSRDAELDDAEGETEQEDPGEHDGDQKASSESGDVKRPNTGDTETDETTDTPVQTESTGQRPTMESIPYKLRRDKVNEGREQVPYFLREDVIERESELQETLEEILGENVYKSDYREAAMVVAQRNPELVAAVLREWGYDLETG